MEVTFIYLKVLTGGGFLPGGGRPHIALPFCLLCLSSPSSNFTTLLPPSTQLCASPSHIEVQLLFFAPAPPLPSLLQVRWTTWWSISPPAPGRPWCALARYNQHSAPLPCPRPSLLQAAVEETHRGVPA